MIPRMPHSRVLLTLLLASLFGLFSMIAQRSELDQGETRPVSGLMQVGQIFRRSKLDSSPRELGKNHELVRRAFQEIVFEANRSTVRVLVDGQQAALGTVISPNGLVLTKSSELDGEIRVRVPRDRSYEAHVVERLRNLDLALVQIANAPVLPAVSLDGATAEPMVGSWVAVPGGSSDIPLAVGVVSSPMRPIRSEMALLGIRMDDDPLGARVREVVRGSSAHEAGIQVGDTVTRVGTESVAGSSQLQRIIRSLSPGDRVELIVRRMGDEQTRVVRATLGTWEHDDLEEYAHTGGRLNNRRSGFAQVIQHDCPLSAHQCGGPLVNARGQVIGINIAKAGRVETYALPVSIVRKRIASIVTLALGAEHDEVVPEHAARGDQLVAAYMPP